MRIPEALAPLLDNGIIHEVVRPLLSGKEAQIYLVTVGGEERVAKVYKEATARNFKHRTQYTEGRTVRNTRDQRAMNRRSRYGRARDEAAWRTAEVDAIYRLQAAGVRVPTPYQYADGVLIMELVRDVHGHPAPRLADRGVGRDQAAEVFDELLRAVVKMLCANVVHGDLSEFNVLMGASGPVVIDFPQSVDATRNPNARRLLLRDVNNLTRFFGRQVPRLRAMRYAEEMWDAYERRQLTPDTELTGRFRPAPAEPATRGASLLEEIAAFERESRIRREALGLPVRPARQPVEVEVAQPMRAGSGDDAGRGTNGGRPRRRRRGGRGLGADRHEAQRGPSNGGAPARAPQGRRPPLNASPPARAADASGSGPPRRKRRRRRGRGRGAPTPGAGT